ncbi:MAG: Mur ligase family protein [Planctomycetota bacterium]|nr:Mur ligase family protein [Planctomycetota bacterium]
MIQSFQGKRVTVVGLGRFGGGVGVTRWLAAQGARVTVSDAAGREALADSVAQLAHLPVTLHLGEHREDDFTAAELLVVNPAVSPEMPLLAAAAAAGVPQTTEINLFLERCAAPVVGITGSVGKSTTTAMTGAILAGVRPTCVGGNIGRSLLDELERITPRHAVVLELSSFQLERTASLGKSPHVAVVTNLQPNHLDRHGTMEAYAQAKKNIFRFQKRNDVLVLNAADDAVASWAAEAHGKVDWFDPDGEPFELKVAGAHNQANAQAAWAATRPFGVDRAAAARALREFLALPHRLQFVREVGGVAYVNDSKCTTPASAIVALEAFPIGAIVAIVGGYDKHVDFAALGAALAERAKTVVALGQVRDQVVAAIEAHRAGRQPTVVVADSFPAAFAAARAAAAPGDTVLLSPACASYDMFSIYEFRGLAFLDIANSL